MVRAEPVWNSFLASNDLLSGHSVLPSADRGGRIHGQQGDTRNEFSAQANTVIADEMFVRISLGTDELDCDIERIENGELELPTVSAVTVTINGKTEETPVWLGEA